MGDNYIIGLAGQSGSGKSYLAEHIAGLLGDYGDFEAIHICGFGDHVRREEHEHTGKSLLSLRAKPTPPEVRKALQKRGMERRAENPDYWILKMEEFIKNEARTNSGHRPDLFIIPDVRFQNEMEWILRRPGSNFVLFYVSAPKKVRRARLGLSLEDHERLASHESEKDIRHYFEEASVGCIGFEAKHIGNSYDDSIAPIFQAMAFLCTVFGI